jgi:hypothetical protein
MLLSPTVPPLKRTLPQLVKVITGFEIRVPEISAMPFRKTGAAF